MKFIFFGFIIAYNPIYVYYLMSHGALGGITFRTIASGIFLVGISYFSFLAFLLNRNGKIKVRNTSFLFLVNILLMFYILAIIVGLVRGNDFKYMILDSFPPLEMFVIYYLIKFSPLIENTINFHRMVKWFLIYFFIMAVTDLASYGVLSFVKIVNFGALRALIGGVTVNRLMDFILPLFLPLLLLSYEYLYRRKWVVILLGMSVLVVLLTFYRTVYSAVFAGIFYLVISSRKRIIFMAKTFVLITFVSVVILVGINSFFKDKKMNFPSLFTQRVASILSPDKKIDYSGTSRVAHDKDMVYNALKSFPDIAGMGGTYESGEGEIIPIYTTSNFFLQLILLLGLPAGLLFLWLYFKTYFVSRRLSREAKGGSEKVFFAAIASILVSLAVILCLFPYTSYFPLLYILGWIFGCIDRHSEGVSANI